MITISVRKWSFFPQIAMFFLALNIPATSAVMIKALTRDISGNGYIDRIEIYLNAEVAVPDTVAMGSLEVEYRSSNGTVTFLATDILSAGTGSTDSVLYVTLQEVQTKEPQTDWRPLVTVDGLSQITNSTIACEDGAGPVIWVVVKIIQDVRDPSTDMVTVHFSEELSTRAGEGTSVSSVLMAWQKNWEGAFVAGDSILSGILFSSAGEADAAMFRMTSGHYLNGDNYLNIRVQNESPVFDNSPARNPAVLANRPVQVLVEPAPSPEKTSGCGSGAGCALVVPFGIRVARTLRRKR